MPRPRIASDLPTRTPYPRDLEEVALELTDRLSLGSVESFQPIPSAFPLHNAVLGGGYSSGDLVVVGGVQNVGKTAWILQDAAGVARQGSLAVIVCYEHTTIHLMERLLCQQSAETNGRITVASLHQAYRQTVEGKAKQGRHVQVGLLDQVMAHLPSSALLAWNHLAEWNKRLWLVQGDSEYTTLDALEAYLQQGLQYADRVVLYVDYAQAVPVFSRERALTVEERVEKLFRFSKSRAMHYAELGKSVVVVLVAAADEEGVRQGRVHFENLWGTAITQFEPDVALILNRDGREDEHTARVRIGIEKNRHGPADVEFRYRYRGEFYAFDIQGERVARSESWQGERDRHTP